MADFDFVTKFLLEMTADFGDDAETRNPGGFVDENDSVFHAPIISKNGENGQKVLDNVKMVVVEWGYGKERCEKYVLVWL